MTYHDKTQLCIIMIAPPELVAEGDRLVKSHGAWMERTHHREGERALLSYNFSKGPELSNPLDLNSTPTGNTCFVLSEIYDGEAGVLDHLEQSKSWEDFQATLDWMAKCKVMFLPAGSIINSLWP